MQLAYHEHLDELTDKVTSIQQTGVRGQFVEISVENKLVAKILLADLADFLVSASAFNAQMVKN